MIADAAFSAYRILSRLATPVVALLLLRRAQQGKEERGRLGERRGEPSRQRHDGPLVWMHGASVGETVSLLPVVDRLVAQRIRVLVTSGTVTSARLLERRLPAGATYQYLPLDTPAYVTRFLDFWKPDLAMIAESEIWPNMIIEADGRGIPIVMVNGRMSERSFRRWRRVPWIAQGLLSRFDLCLAQSDADGQRLAELGAPRVTVVGNLKFDAPPPPADLGRVATMQGMIAGRPVWMAASTHPGEEEVILNAHLALRQQFPNLLTIIAPRHPHRGGDIEKLAYHVGLRAAVRSLGAQPDRGIDIYVADTIGEMGLFYRIAPLALIGGSLVPHGGQNPIEPAKLGTAILHGPYIHNFSDIFAALNETGGAVAVSADTLIPTVSDLIGDAAGLRSMARAAASTVAGLGGAVDRTMVEIAPFLVRIYIESR
jgi:3-deoxy-D-manno-octulosonic-acid transferase